MLEIFREPCSRTGRRDEFSAEPFLSVPMLRRLSVLILASERIPGTLRLLMLPFPHLLDPLLYGSSGHFVCVRVLVSPRA